MSLVQLQYFIAIAEEGHLTRAAARLHISQPPLSRQLRSLEDELGASLFVRTPKGMRLLPTGEALLPKAREILALVSAASGIVQTQGPHLPESGNDSPTSRRRKQNSLPS